MKDFILIDGDQVLFQPAFGQATVIVQPGRLKGSGKSSIAGKKVCVDGDENKVSVQGCMYTTPIHSIPGTGTLKIASLTGSHKGNVSKSGGKPVLLKGGNFTASFEVMSPAQQPPPNPGPPIPDSTPKYTGEGSFITQNMSVKGS